LTTEIDNKNRRVLMVIARSERRALCFVPHADSIRRGFRHCGTSSLARDAVVR
jgi:hypothetical protein